MAEFWGPAPYRSRYGRSITDLMLQRGDILANQAQQSGQIWGNVAQQLGEIGAGAVEQYQMQKSAEEQAALEQQRTKAFGDLMRDPKMFESPGYAMKQLLGVGYSPEQSFKMAQGFSAWGESQKKKEVDPTKALPHAQKLATAYVAADEPTRELLRPALTQWAQNSELDPEDQLSQASPEDFLKIAQGLAGPQEAEAAFTLAPGSARYSSAGELIAEQPFKPEKDLAQIQAESAARARGTAAGRPVGPVSHSFQRAKASVGGDIRFLNYDKATGKFYNPDTNEIVPGAEPAPTAMLANRKAAAESSIKAGKGIFDTLNDPEFSKEIGFAMGRYNSLMAAVGEGDPKAQYLVGLIRSFSALQPQIHGFRAFQMAEDIEKLLTTKQSPEALKAGLQGVLSASYIVAGKPVPEFGLSKKQDDLEQLSQDLSYLPQDDFDALLKALEEE